MQSDKPNFIPPLDKFSTGEHRQFQHLENISTAYWYSQVLFTALELGIFRHLDQGHGSIEKISAAADCKPDELKRLLRALLKIGLVIQQEKGQWYNTPISEKFLVPDKDGYIGDFLLYRQYMRPNWDNLTQKISTRKPAESRELSYAQKNFLYAAAMDTIVRQKAREIAKIVAPLGLSGNVLDVGGGAGGMVREILMVMPGSRGLLFEIPEIINAAEQLYPEPGAWEQIDKVSGDYRNHVFDTSFGLIILSNFLHTYSPEEARELILKAAGILNPNGCILIHDYFPDRAGNSPSKGALYDLNMMLNTYNGACHETGPITKWLTEAGIQCWQIKDLATDTSVILAGPSL